MNTRNDTVIVAADGGGTGCRAAAGTLSQGVLGEARGGPGNVHSDFDAAIANLTGAIAAALAKAGLEETPLDRITAHLGVAGAHSEVEMAQVVAGLPYGRVSVTGDRATSVRGVLGEADGYVVALGTGTIVARQHALEMRTVGGWGFDLSDQASGAWLGHRLLREAVLAEDGLQAHTDLTRRALEDKGGLIATVHFSATATPGDYAPLARPVIEAAKDGDEIAQGLMREGAAYIETGLTTLGFQPGDRLALAGGVGPHYAAYLPAHMTRNLVQPKGTALDGAFAMACAAARDAAR
ncbi:BadF/BadG/BcrA/BcrD ATPase family protein [Marimonas sp. MJW-29]|uniref:BadF/BadG/BcrA/BcrD ATPase family protein n=1 Tax=Sulfitobacter sediminis TaxID=3234186 RepID=A0ABV3RQ39_9RHOB